jgi:uncharacterized lipoprotein YmbA
MNRLINAPFASLVSRLRNSMNNSISPGRPSRGSGNLGFLGSPGFRLALAIASLAGMTKNYVTNFGDTTLVRCLRRLLNIIPIGLTRSLLCRETVPQRSETVLSSRTKVRDLRFLPAVEMTEKVTETKGEFRHRHKRSSLRNSRYEPLVFVLLGLSLAGCGTLSPRPNPSRFFTLTAIAQPGATATKDSSNPGGISLGIGPIRLPSYLDRQEIVTRVSPNRFDVSENDRWAEPLETNFTRVLAQNLAVLLNTDQLVSYPWEMNRRPAYQVEVEVLHFETNAGGDVQLSARWTVLDPNKKIRLKSGETVLTRQPATKSTDASVAALSETLGDLSREIANAISAIEGQKK